MADMFGDDSTFEGPTTTTSTETKTELNLPASTPPPPKTKPPVSLINNIVEAKPEPQFTIPTDKSFVRYGDLVSLFDQLGSTGFLNADGVIDDSLRIIRRKNGALPDKFRDCIFKIMPSQQYAAQKEYRKKVLALQLAVDEEEENEGEQVPGSNRGTEDDEGYYESLQDSAAKELEMNEENNAEKIEHSTVLKYGHTIQLVHHKTKKYVTADAKRVAAAEKDCQYVGVEAGGSAYSWFTVLPRYKMRQLGDEVETNDCVIFELNKQAGTYLHCSSLPAPQLVPFQAGNALLHEGSIGARTGWTITLYRSAADGGAGRAAERGTLQAGTLVRMYHTEARSFVGIKTNILKTHAKRTKKDPSQCTAASLVHIEKPEHVDIATWRPPASSVWILETLDRISGPTAGFQRQYRLRHFATGSYLYRRSEKKLIETLAKNNKKLKPGLPPVQINIGEKLSLLDTGGVSFTSTSCDDTKAIPLDTGCYLRANAAGTASAEDDALYSEEDQANLFMGQTKQGDATVRNNLEWDPEGSSEDTIKFLGVRESEVQELEILSSLVPFVQNSKNNLNPRKFKPANCKLLLMKLRLLLAYIYRQNFIHVPSVEVKVYDPQNEAGVPAVASRQQAARELGAVQAVVELISHCGNYFVSIGPSGTVIYKPPSDEFQTWMQRLVSVLFLIVEAFIDNHEDNQNFVAVWLPAILLKYIDCDVNAERMITTMLTSNRPLLEGKVGQTTMQRFLDLVFKKGVDESALRFLAEVSAADGEAVESNQTKICEKLLRMAPELLLKTSLIGENSSETKSNNRRPIRWTSTVDIKEFKADDGGEIMGESVRASILPFSVGWGEKAAKKSCQQLFGSGTVTLERLSEELSHADDMKYDDDVDQYSSPGKKKDASYQRLRIANCYVQQMHLLAELCKDRNYIAINLLADDYPFTMCISVVANTKIHTRIRSEFARLCSALWVDVAPQQKLLVPNFTRSWEDSEKNIETLPAARQSNKFIMVQELIANHFNGLGGATKVWDEDTNRLTLEFLTITRHLVEFGFYNTIGSLRNLCDPLVSTLDGRNDDAIPPVKFQAKRASKGTSRAASISIEDSASFTQALTRRRTSRAAKEKEDEASGKRKKKKKPKKKTSSLTKKSSIVPGGLRNLGSGMGSMLHLGGAGNAADNDDEAQEEERKKKLNDTLRYARNDQNELVALSKMQICDVLVAVSRFTTDVRMSHLVMNLKIELSKKDSNKVLDDVDGVIDKVIETTDYLDTDNLSENTDICDVLMDLCKYDCPPLTTSVVDLMLAQVSQKRELMEGASKLQLLFSKAEVEAWTIIQKKVIKTLDLIERHEVWCVLESEDDKEQSRITMKLLNWILMGCTHGLDTKEMPDSDGDVDNRTVKKMMLNARVIPALTEIFNCNANLPGKDLANANTRKIASKINQVLQGLCRKTPAIQNKLFDYLEKIMEWNNDLSNPNSGFATLTDIFTDNLEVCERIGNEKAAEITASILNRKHFQNGYHFNGALLDPLMALVICNGAPVRRNQRTVMQSLWEPENQELLILFNEVGEGTPHGLRDLMRKMDCEVNDIYVRPNGMLAYYIALLHLLSACCRGKATVEEVRCKSLFTFNELAEVIIHKETLWVVKLPVIMLLYDAYLDSDIGGEGVESMQENMPLLLNELLKILKGGAVIHFLDVGMAEPEGDTILSSPSANSTSSKNKLSIDTKTNQISKGAKAWAVKKEVLAFAGVGGSRGTTTQMANFNFNGILDFVIGSIAGIVGQELYVKACPERDEIITDARRTLRNIAKCRRVNVCGHEIRLTESQISKCEFAWNVTQNGGDVGAWVDPTLHRSKGGAAAQKNKGKGRMRKRRQSAVPSMANNSIGKSVLWIVKRMSKHPKLIEATANELDPIVDRTLLALQRSTQCNHLKLWNVLPPVDLWGILPAPKVKIPARPDGSIVKLIKHIVLHCNAHNDLPQTKNVTCLRMVELFYAVLTAAKNYRGVKVEEHKLDKNGFPKVVYYPIPDIKGAREDYLELICAQLIHMGVGEVLMYLLGQDWLEDEVYEKVVDFSIDLLKFSHVNVEDSRVVQANMINFLSKDLGEPATISIAKKLDMSEVWAKEKRDKLKLKTKTLKNEIKAARKAKMIRLDRKGLRSPTATSAIERGAIAELELEKHINEQKEARVCNKPDLASYSELLASIKEGDHDPGASKKLLRLLDLFSSGQYTKGQLFMSDQPNHKVPVNFLQDATRYISAMAKDFEIHHGSLLQSYGSLKSFLTGPCKPNQLSMAIETECVLITNRILRELYKKAKVTYYNMEANHYTHTRLHNLSKKQERQDEKDKVTQWSILGKEVIETLLSMIEGRTDNIVHHRLLAVIQRNTLRDRLQLLAEKISSKFFNSETIAVLTEEGVEIMNLLMTLCEHDQQLYKEVMVGENEPYWFFRSKMGRVEIVFHDNILPVFFLIPPMCQVFSHVPLGKMWEKCLPRDESTLVQYQYESMRIFDMMKQERELLRLGVSKFFGTGKLEFMSQVSFSMALLINGISIGTLAYSDDQQNATQIQWTPEIIADMNITTGDIQTVLTLLQIFTSSYLLAANAVLNLPVVYRTAHRDRVNERIKLGLGKELDPWSVIVPVWKTMTEFMFVYQLLYLGFAMLSIYFTTMGPIFNSFHLMSIAVRNPVARNIFMAVIYPIHQLKIAGVVAFFLLYIFAIFQFFFFHSFFENGECNTLRSCLVYTVNWGTRSGGGIGETMPDPDLWSVVKTPDTDDWVINFEWLTRATFDFLFFLIIIIIIMNIVFGIIIDTFSDLRSQRDEKTKNMTSMCFICGIGRDKFDQEGQTDFKRHCEYEHNKWHYLFYLIHCQLMAEEAPDDINAYERFVLTQFLVGDISWMPLGKAISMGSAIQPDPEEETNHVGHNVALMNKTVETMKNDLIDLKDSLGDQMSDVKSQIALLLGKLK